MVTDLEIVSFSFNVTSSINSIISPSKAASTALCKVSYPAFPMIATGFHAPKIPFAVGVSAVPSFTQISLSVSPSIGLS